MFQLVGFGLKPGVESSRLFPQNRLADAADIAQRMSEINDSHRLRAMIINETLYPGCAIVNSHYLLSVFHAPAVYLGQRIALKVAGRVTPGEVVFDNRKCQQRIIENVSIMTSNTTNRSSKMSAVGH